MQIVVTGDESQTKGACWCDDHAIERIAQMLWQRGDRVGMCGTKMQCEGDKKSNGDRLPMNPAGPGLHTRRLPCADSGRRPAGLLGRITPFTAAELSSFDIAFSIRETHLLDGTLVTQPRRVNSDEALTNVPISLRAYTVESADLRRYDLLLDAARSA